MTLILDIDLDILKMYLRTKNEVCRLRYSEDRARTGQTQGQTDRQTARRDQTHHHVTFLGGNEGDAGYVVGR